MSGIAKHLLLRTGAVWRSAGSLNDKRECGVEHLDGSPQRRHYCADTGCHSDSIPTTREIKLLAHCLPGGEGAWPPVGKAKW